MSDLHIKYLVNDAIFGHVTIITFYVECCKESIRIKKLWQLHLKKMAMTFM